MAKRIYADYAAATPIDPQVVAAMAEVTTWANPGSPYTEGVEARQQLDVAQARVAKVLGSKPHEVVFTSGSTEGLNLAIQGVLAQYPQGEVVSSRLEHAAVTGSLEGKPVAWVTVPPSGVLSPDAVAAAITDRTVLVAVMYANNEIGTIQPIAKVAAIIKQVRLDRQQRGVDLPIYLLSDAAQAGWLSLAVDRLGVDLLTLGGGKLYGPRGCGVLYVRDGVQLQPLLHGGGQQRGRRSGTENVVGAVGLAAALDTMQAERQEQTERLAALRDSLESGLTKLIPELQINGSKKLRLPQFSNLSFDGIDGETLVAYLDAQGVAAATGSACNAASEEPSATLLAIGLTSQQAIGSLRLTFGRQTTQQDIDRLIELLPPLITKLSDQ